MLFFHFFSSEKNLLFLAIFQRFYKAKLPPEMFLTVSCRLEQISLFTTPKSDLISRAALARLSAKFFVFG